MIKTEDQEEKTEKLQNRHGSSQSGVGGFKVKLIDSHFKKSKFQLNQQKIHAKITIVAGEKVFININNTVLLRDCYFLLLG